MSGPGRKAVTSSRRAALAGEMTARSRRSSAAGTEAAVGVGVGVTAGAAGVGVALGLGCGVGWGLPLRAAQLGVAAGVGRVTSGRAGAPRLQAVSARTIRISVVRRVRRINGLYPKRNKGRGQAAPLVSFRSLFIPDTRSAQFPPTGCRSPARPWRWRAPPGPAYRLPPPGCSPAPPGWRAAPAQSGY